MLWKTGYAAGTGISSAVQAITGVTIGGWVYDWMHPNEFSDISKPIPFPITDQDTPKQCKEGDDQKRKKYCQALKDSILNTCAGLTGRVKFKCFAAADRAYRQCMGYE